MKGGVFMANPGKKQKFVISSPRGETVLMSFPGKINKAVSGNRAEQWNIVSLFKSRVCPNSFVDWKELEIKDKNGKIRKKSSKMPSSNKPKISAPTKRPAEKYGCECDCPACDQGHHKSCKKNCKCGQYI